MNEYTIQIRDVNYPCCMGESPRDALERLINENPEFHDVDGHDDDVRVTDAQGNEFWMDGYCEATVQHLWTIKAAE